MVVEHRGEAAEPLRVIVGATEDLDEPRGQVLDVAFVLGRELLGEDRIAQAAVVLLVGQAQPGLPAAGELVDRWLSVAHSGALLSSIGWRGSRVSTSDAGQSAATGSPARYWA